ncbi:hypothetical protein H920_13371 [Fukomys damarensis]|uniref:Uncharacterized protein n=1 Tax=Fukomys damarensis TaxID=885580 RepID=A0A091D4M4_FUKDA|nr:hypothetical protein H920_13371 [Fukomys damarensis]
MAANRTEWSLWGPETEHSVLSAGFVRLTCVAYSGSVASLNLRPMSCNPSLLMAGPPNVRNYVKKWAFHSQHTIQGPFPAYHDCCNLETLPRLFYLEGPRAWDLELSWILQLVVTVQAKVTTFHYEDAAQVFSLFAALLLTTCS